jgi:hypothetical protein
VGDHELPLVYIGTRNDNDLSVLRRILNFLRGAMARRTVPALRSPPSAMGFNCGPDGRVVEVPAELHFDFDANALFVSFYLAPFLTRSRSSARRAHRSVAVRGSTTRCAPATRWSVRS